MCVILYCYQEKYEIESDENRIELAKILYDRYIRRDVCISIIV